jgi:tetratricopeptide (TPR) repeat protein
MVKIITTLIIISFIACLSAQDVLMDKFTEYNQDRTEKNLIEALNYYHSLKQEDPEDYQASLLLSYIHYMELNKYIVVMNDNIDSLNTRTQFQFANLLLSLNQFEQSIDVYDLITDQLPRWSCPWRHKGEAYYKAGDLESSEIALIEAINTREEHYDAYVWLSFVQKEQERYPEALKTLQTGLTYYGKDIEDPDEEVDALDVKFLLLELYEKNNMDDEYDVMRNKLLREAPDDHRWDGVKELQEIH